MAGTVFGDIDPVSTVFAGRHLFGNILGETKNDPAPIHAHGLRRLSRQTSTVTRDAMTASWRWWWRW